MIGAVTETAVEFAPVTPTERSPIEPVNGAATATPIAPSPATVTDPAVPDDIVPVTGPAIDTPTLPLPPVADSETAPLLTNPIGLPALKSTPIDPVVALELIVPPFVSVLLELIVAALPLVTAMAPPLAIVMLPALLFAAVAVATGVVCEAEIVRSSARAGPARVAMVAKASDAAVPPNRP